MREGHDVSMDLNHYKGRPIIQRHVAVMKIRGWGSFSEALQVDPPFVPALWRSTPSAWELRALRRTREREQRYIFVLQQILFEPRNSIISKEPVT